MLREVIAPFEEKIKQFHKDKVLSSIRQEDLLHPAWGWDNRLLRGQNGIGTLWGRKTEDVNAPFPRLQCRMLIGDGVQTKGFSWGDEDPQLDDDNDSLVALYRCSYTTPCVRLVTYSDHYLRRAKVGLCCT